MWYMNKPNFEVDPAIAGGGAGAGGTTPLTPDAATIEKETTELQTLLGVTTPDATQKTRLTELQGKYTEQYIGADGKALTEDQIKVVKEVETKVNTILAKEESTRTPEEKKFLVDNTEPDLPNKKFYEQVDELAGTTYTKEIDYNGVDPHTPEGALIREEYIREEGAQIYQEEFKEKFPLAYTFLEHLQAGGKPEDFFQRDTQNFLEITLNKDDKGQQERIIRTSLGLKKLSPVLIDATLTNLKDSAKLYEAAQSELEALQAEQKKRETDRTRGAAEKRNRTLKDVGEFNNVISTALEKGFDNLVIPVADRKGFGEFVTSQIKYQEGEFFRVAKLNPKEVNKFLKSAYFEFKGGDITGLATRVAKTQQALRIKGAIKPQFIPKSNATEGKKFVPLSQL